jgi:hypothetical protein
LEYGHIVILAYSDTLILEILSVFSVYNYLESKMAKNENKSFELNGAKEVESGIVTKIDLTTHIDDNGNNQTTFDYYDDSNIGGPVTVKDEQLAIVLSAIEYLNNPLSEIKLKYYDNNDGKYYFSGFTAHVTSSSHPKDSK